MSVLLPPLPNLMSIYNGLLIHLKSPVNHTRVIYPYFIVKNRCCILGPTIVVSLSVKRICWSSPDKPKKKDTQKY